MISAALQPVGDQVRGVATSLRPWGRGAKRGRFSGVCRAEAAGSPCSCVMTSFPD